MRVVALLSTLIIPSIPAAMTFDSSQNGTTVVSIVQATGSSGIVSTGSTTSRTIADRFAACYDVRDFGANCDGTTDDAASIQAAINAVPSATGGCVEFPAGKTCAIGTGLTASANNLLFRCGGGGTGQYALVGLGACVVKVNGAIVGFTYNPTASSTKFAGPVIRGLTFSGSSAGLGGILIKRANNYKIEDVSVTGFTAGYGIKNDGTGNVNQYGTIENPNLSNDFVAIDSTATNGLRVIGGMIDANSNGSPDPTVVITGSVGIRQGSGDTLRVFGTVIQFAETGIDLQLGENPEIHGVRLEAFTTGVHVGGNVAHATVFGGSFNNSIKGTSGTGILVDSGATNSALYPGSMIALTTNVNDSGTDTTWQYGNFMHFGNGMNLYKGGTGAWQLQDNILVARNVVVDQGNFGSALLFGSAQLAGVMYGSGSPAGVVSAPPGRIYLNTAGGAGTTFYVKESGIGSTGWIAK